MTKETLLATLEAERLKTGGEAIAIPEDRDATVIVGGPGESMQIGKLVKIEPREGALCLETAKGERYWFTYDLVLGIRFRTSKMAKEHSTGFSR